MSDEIKLRGVLEEVGVRDDGTTYFIVACPLDDARAAGQLLFRGELDVTLALATKEAGRE